MRNKKQYWWWDRQTDKANSKYHSLLLVGPYSRYLLETPRQRKSSWFTECEHFVTFWSVIISDGGHRPRRRKGWRYKHSYSPL